MSSQTRTYVTFQSNSFNSSESRDYFINPSCFGDDLCKWLIQRLTDAGVQCDAEPGQEDFGWYFNFQVDETIYCFVCGHRPGDDVEPDCWIGWLEKSVGFFAGLFGGRDKGIGSEALIRIHQVLSGAPEITNVRWHYKADFYKGNEAGAERPDA